MNGFEELRREISESLEILPDDATLMSLMCRITDTIKIKFQDFVMPIAHGDVTRIQFYIPRDPDNMLAFHTMRQIGLVEVPNGSNGNGASAYYRFTPKAVGVYKECEREASFARSE